jgi:predicted RecB family nuclease
MAVAGDSVPFALLPEVGGSSRPIARLWRRADAPLTWSLTRRDVELDVDMESAPSGVYLWGTLLSYRAGIRQYLDLPSGYRGFGGEFGDPSGATATAFVAFFDFLDDLRRRCAVDGRTLGIYCYSGPSAEEPALRRGAVAAAEAGGVDRSSDVEELIVSDEWIDLLSEVRARVSTLHGHGLKAIARATGFDWRVGDAGGEASMRWYERATTDPRVEVRMAHRAKILSYNEDDVLATRHLRWWFSTHARLSVPLVP